MHIGELSLRRDVQGLKIAARRWKDLCNHPAEDSGARFLTPRSQFLACHSSGT